MIRHQQSSDIGTTDYVMHPCADLDHPERIREHQATLRVEGAWPKSCGCVEWVAKACDGLDHWWTPRHRRCAEHGGGGR